MTKSKEKVDQNVIDSIKKSSEKFRQMYPILVDANDELIDGRHRSKVFKNPETKKLDFIKTKKERLEASLVANHARKGQNKSTWEFTLKELAKVLEREGVEKIGLRIAEETGLPYRTLMRFLPSKFKDQAQSERASKPRLPIDSRIPEETERESVATAQSLVQPPAKTNGEIHESRKEEPLSAMEILKEYKDAVKEDMPRIKIKEFANQPWKAIILPKDFFEKLRQACERSRLDMEEVITLALLRVLEDLRRKNRCLEKM